MFTDKVAAGAHACAFMLNFLARNNSHAKFAGKYCAARKTLFICCLDQTPSDIARIKRIPPSWDLQQPKTDNDCTRSYSLHVPQLPSPLKVHLGQVHERP